MDPRGQLGGSLNGVFILGSPGNGGGSFNEIAIKVRGRRRYTPFGGLKEGDFLLDRGVALHEPPLWPAAASRLEGRSTEA